jgi:hypothetical protein
VSIDAEAAIEAARALFGETPDRIIALAAGDGLWYVNAVDSEGRPWAGSSVIVGPDGQVWSFSSNPAIPDPAVVDEAVAGIYQRGVAGFVEPALLADRIAAAPRRSGPSASRSSMTP